MPLIYNEKRHDEQRGSEVCAVAAEIAGGGGFAGVAGRLLPPARVQAGRGLEAKPGKDAAVVQFLEGALPLANQENTTPVWFALRLGPTSFGIFDAFRDDAGRKPISRVPSPLR
jgi:hypothetical protein